VLRVVNEEDNPSSDDCETSSREDALHGIFISPGQVIDDTVEF
jgi:hypothetical protein